MLWLPKFCVLALSVLCGFSGDLVRGLPSPSQDDTLIQPSLFGLWVGGSVNDKALEKKYVSAVPLVNETDRLDPNAPWDKMHLVVYVSKVPGSQSARLESRTTENVPWLGAAFAIVHRDELIYTGTWPGWPAYTTRAFPSTKNLLNGPIFAAPGKPDTRNNTYLSSLREEEILQAFVLRVYEDPKFEGVYGFLACTSYLQNLGGEVWEVREVFAHNAFLNTDGQRPRVDAEDCVPIGIVALDWLNCHSFGDTNPCSLRKKL